MASPLRPSAPRRRAPQERPAEILAAALVEFAEKGFAAARLEDVARRAGCSKAAIYLYYRDKTALFEAVVRRTVVGHIDETGDAIARFEGTTRDLVRSLVGMIAMKLMAEGMPSICKLVIAESRAFPDLARFWHREVISRAMPMLEAIVRRGVDRGEFRAVDPGFAARSIVAPFLLAALWRAVFEPVGADTLDVERFLEAHADFVVAALTRHPGEGA